MRIIAITGGIGSGKSVVSRVVEAMGYHVYDCDSQARRLMDESDIIKRDIIRRIGESCVKSGRIDRAELAKIVFNSEEKLAELNSIVHGAVREHLAMWTDHLGASETLCFVETAILYQSGLDAMVDEVWEITAPVELRIERVMKRNGLTSEEVRARIDSQDSYEVTSPHPCRHFIENDGDRAILPRIEQFLSL